MNEIIVKQETTQLTQLLNGMSEALEQLGLPSDNIIAEVRERQIIAKSLPDLIQQIPQAHRRQARYLSKFIAGSAIGLFDAALNYVWNEVVLNLRERALAYDVELFYDAAIGAPIRAEFNDENDLPGLKDEVLVNTCYKLELIQEIVHKKLKHILAMRNDVAASHPNVSKIGAFELLGWLETCVNEVLMEKPSVSAIQVTKIIGNLRKSPDIYDSTTIDLMKSGIGSLATAHTNTLIIRLFGMYCSDAVSTTTKQNILKLAPVFWENCSDSAKLEISTSIDGYKRNLDSQKSTLAKSFLETVDGLSWLSLDLKNAEIKRVLTNLLDARYSWDNFYKEPAHAKELELFVKSSGDISPIILTEFCKVLLICRIGKGVNFNGGVSPGAKPSYDRLLSKLDETGILEVLRNILGYEIYCLVDNDISKMRLTEILQILKSNSAKKSTISIIDAIEKAVSGPGIEGLTSDKKFRELTAEVWAWK